MASSNLKRFMIPGALVIGGITAGSMLAPVALAAADDAITDDDIIDDDSTDTTESTNRHRHIDHHPVAEALIETLGLTAGELRAAFAEGKSPADIAGEQGVAVEDLEAALVEAANERIDRALAAERIDADRAAELKAEVDDRIAEMITRTPGDGFGHPHRRHHGFGGGEVAEFLGMTTDELRAALSEGQTLAEVAEAQGVSEDDLVAYLLEQLEERLDQAVENGRLDADDVDEKLADAADRIEEHINAEPGERPDGRRWRHGHRHHHHGDRGGNQTDSGDTDTEGETVESSVDV